MMDWGCNDNGRCDFRKGGRLSAFDAVFHAVAGAFSIRTVSAWWRRRSSTAEVIVLSPLKMVAPLFEGFVGGKDDRTAFVALADDLEEQVGSALVDGKIADLSRSSSAGER